MMPGPFYFAWVNPNTAFNAVTHAVEDEKIVQFTIEQLEGEFATLSIDVRRPQVDGISIGLLSATRKVWAWLSQDTGSEIVPLFFGRLVAIPGNLHGEIVTMNFMARPLDFQTQKVALAATMRTLPFFDPVFITPEKRFDPDSVLEARTEVWHTDRVTHVVTTSDLIVGEDGTLEFEEDSALYDTIQMSLDQPPVRMVRLTAEVPWSQVVSGSIPAFRDIRVYTKAGKGLIDGWPKPDASGLINTGLGGGWFATNSADRGDGTVTTEAKSPQENFSDQDALGFQDSIVGHGGLQPLFINPILITSFNASSSKDGSSSESVTHMGVVNFDVFCSLALRYEATRQRKDILIINLVADSQPVVTLPDDGDFLEVNLSGVNVSEDQGFFGPAPIGELTRRSFFAQPRGWNSIKYLLQLARAHIIGRSRAVKIEFGCTFERGRELSLRKNVLLHDRRFPGGTAVGKITGYVLTCSGGRIGAHVTIASTIGYGGSVSPNAGVPTYVEDGYVEDGYQFREGEIQVSPAGDVGFTVFVENPNDDGLVFPIRGSPPWYDEPHVVNFIPDQAQIAAPELQGTVDNDDCGNTTSISQTSTLDTGPLTNWLAEIRTSIDFALHPVTGGPFETTYELTTTVLKLPKQIDLEASP